MTTMIVLSGGQGLRMQSRTQGHPKHLVQLGSEPLVTLTARRIASQIPVDNCFFRLAYRPSSMLNESKYLLGSLSCQSCHFLFGRLEDGPIGAMLDSVNLIDDIDFIVVAGDTIYVADDIKVAYEAHQKSKIPLTVLAGQSFPSRRPSTLMISDQGMLTGYSRKELTDEMDFINAGIYFIHKPGIGWLTRVFNDYRSENSKLEFKEDHLWAEISNSPNKAYVHRLKDKVINVNEPNDLQNARSYLGIPSENRVDIFGQPA